MPSLAAYPAPRMASFSLEEFGDLVSSALDLHAHLGSNLDLAFGSQLSLSLPQSETRQSSEIDHDLSSSEPRISPLHVSSQSPSNGGGLGHTNKDALDTRSIVSSDETRRLASSSSPTLALNPPIPRPPPKHRLNPSVRKSMSMSRLDMSFAQHHPSPSRPAPFQPPIEAPLPRRENSPHPSSTGSFRLPSLVTPWAKPRKEQDPNDKVPRGRLSSMSFFASKLKSFHKLSKKSPKATKECNGLRSFFEDMEQDGSSPQSCRSSVHQVQASMYAVSRAAQKHNIAQAKKPRSKGLPPMFDMNARSFTLPPIAYNQWEPTMEDYAYTRPARSPHRSKGSTSSSRTSNTLFYNPPSTRSPSFGDGDSKSVSDHSCTSRMPPPPPSLCIYGYPYTPRHVPSPLSPPTYSLPPTPSMGTVPLPSIKDYPVPRPLPTKAKADDAVSVNSDEINSWRGGRSGSAAATDRSGDDVRSEFSSMVPRCTTPSERRSCNSARTTPKPRPHSGMTSTNSSKSASAKSLLHPLKLASASFVSLRSATGMTNAIFKNGCDSPASLEWGSDRESALASGRVLTPDEDPFAGPQLPSPASSCSLTPETPVHPYAAVDHAKPITVQHTPKAEKKIKLYSQDGGNVLQTPIRISATPKKSNAKGTPHMPGSSPTTPTNSRQARKERGLSLNATAKKRNSFVFPLPPTPASLSSGNGDGSSDDYFYDATLEANNVPFPRSTVISEIPHISMRASLRNAIPNSKRAKAVPKLTRNGTFDLHHSDSRPHSPFPLRCLSNVSVATALGAPVDFTDTPPPVAFTNTSDARPDSSLISEHDALMIAPATLATKDAHAFAEACDVRDAAREMVSPTAWFLDSDSDSCADHGEIVEKLEIPGATESEDSDLEPLLHSSRWDSFWDSCSLFERQPNLVPSSEPDSRTETTETSEEKLTELNEAWPLPPHRTIVVDESSEEGWHDVESMVEYAPTEGAVPAAWQARHSIRFPSSSISSDFCVYNDGVISPSGGFNATRTTRTLSVEQTRFITQQLNNLKAAREGLNTPHTPGACSDRDDHRSTKSSYFTARSVERTSLKSNISKTSAQSVRVVVQDEKTMKAAAATYISPPVSPVTPRVRVRSRSAAAALGAEKRLSVASRPDVSVKGSKIDLLQLGTQHALRLDAAEDAIVVHAVNLKQFLDFCDEHKLTMIASGAEGAKLLVNRTHVVSDDGDVPSMPGGLPSRPKIEVTLRLAIGSYASSGDTDACLDLPVTFADISASIVKCTP